MFQRMQPLLLVHVFSSTSLTKSGKMKYYLLYERTKNLNHYYDQVVMASECNANVQPRSLLRRRRVAADVATPCYVPELEKN